MTVNTRARQMWEEERRDTHQDIPELRPDLPNAIANILEPEAGLKWLIEVRDWYRLTGWSLLVGFGDTGTFTLSIYHSTALEWADGTRTVMYAGSNPVSSGQRVELDVEDWAPLLLGPGDILSGEIVAVAGTVSLAAFAPWFRRLPHRRPPVPSQVLGDEGEAVIDDDGGYVTA